MSTSLKREISSSLAGIQSTVKRLHIGEEAIGLDFGATTASADSTSTSGAFSIGAILETSETPSPVHSHGSNISPGAAAASPVSPLFALRPQHSDASVASTTPSTSTSSSSDIHSVLSHLSTPPTGTAQGGLFSSSTSQSPPRPSFIMSGPPHKRISSPVELFAPNSAPPTTTATTTATTATTTTATASATYVSGSNFTTPAGIGITIPHHPITTVMSTAGDDFASKYELLGEIGRGGFSVVHHCRHRLTGKSFAAKLIDLRPLRLRDKFDPMRLRREVDIMRQLRHPNIIQFEEVFESPDQLFVIMEFAPGYELFDAILARGYYSEDDARPIFFQIAKALTYLHSLDIMHRDIKPENILVLREADPVTQLPIAKLLDFGLSKHTGLGSGAKTFVGTPCYLAPEVEFASKTAGATYGTPADCWSLGAVLYVMLVARFPVFEVDNRFTPPRLKLSLPNELFRNISNEAKDLLLSLMNFDPNDRMTAKGSLAHPWLKNFRVPFDRLDTFCAPEAKVQEFAAYSATATPSPEPAIHGALSVSPRKSPTAASSLGLVKMQKPQLETAIATQDQLGITPLLVFQKNVATCFDEAVMAYQYMPEVAAEVRRGAVLCRQQLTESTKMLRKIEQTACSVLDMFPDLELAITENEPLLANEFFGMVKGWVAELLSMVGNTQKANKASMDQIQTIVEKSAIELKNEALVKNATAALGMLTMATRPAAAATRGGGEVVPVDNLLSASSINTGTLMKMKEMLNVVLNKDKDKIEASRTADTGSAMEIAPIDGTGPSAASGEAVEIQLLRLFDVMLGKVLDSQLINNRPTEAAPGQVELLSPTTTPDVMSPTDTSKRPPPPPRPDFGSPSQFSSAFVEPDFEEEEELGGGAGGMSREDTRTASSFSSDSSSNNTDARNQKNRAMDELQNALQMLRQVDIILEQLSVFWANTEVVLDILTKKGQHTEHFISFAHKPKLLARFMDRVVDYRNFWEGIKTMCQSYLVGVQEPAKKLDRFSTPPGDLFFHPPTTVP